MQDIILKAINEMILDKCGYMKMLLENTATVIRNDASASTDDIDAKLLGLKKELLQNSNNHDDYDSFAELCNFLKKQPREIIPFNESLVRRLLQKITIFEHHLTVEFRSAISVDING